MWNTKHELKLVELMKEKEHMWNSSHQNYNNRNLKQKTYLEISKTFGDPFTVSSVKDKWTDICMTFTITMKNVERDEKVSWHLWEVCQFLAGARSSSKVKIEDMSDDVPLGHYMNGEISNFDIQDDTMRNVEHAWDPEDDMQLIELVKEKEILWNTKHRNYKNRALKQKVMSQVAEAMGGAISGKVINDRWTSIQEIFKLNVKKLEKSQKSGIDFKPSWHLWDKCRFMLKRVKSKRKWKLANEDSPDVQPDGNGLPHITDISLTDEKFMENIEKKHNFNVDTNVSGNSPCELLLKEALPLLAAIRQEIQTIKYEDFGKHVSMCLGKLSPDDAKSAKQKVLDILAMYSEKMEESDAFASI